MTYLLRKVNADLITAYDVLVDNVLLETSSILDSLEDIEFDYVHVVSGFFAGTSAAGIAFNNSPSEITNSGVTWGDFLDGVRLNSTITSVSNIDELISQIENGLETGAFQSLQVFDNGTEIFRLSGTKANWSISSGDLSFELSGVLPTSLSGFVDFAKVLNDASDFLGVTQGYYWDQATGTFVNRVSTPLSLTETERDLVIADLKNYKIDDFAVVYEGQTRAEISLTADTIAIELLGGRIELGGTFPNTSIGEVLEVLRTFQNQDLYNQKIYSLEQFENLALNSLKVIGSDGDVLLNIQGEITAIDSFTPSDLSTATLFGVNLDDVASLNPSLNTDLITSYDVLVDNVLLETSSILDSLEETSA
jgi:hypothetical protein